MNFLHKKCDNLLFIFGRTKIFFHFILFGMSYVRQSKVSRCECGAETWTMEYGLKSWHDIDDPDKLCLMNINPSGGPVNTRLAFVMERYKDMDYETSLPRSGYSRVGGSTLCYMIAHQKTEQRSASSSSSLPPVRRSRNNRNCCCPGILAIIGLASIGVGLFFVL
jgi:hypothetical protein